MNRRYGRYTQTGAVSHPKPQDGGDHVTDVTDVTSNRKGCTYRASAGARARSRYRYTPLSDGVTSVTSVTHPEPSGGFAVSRSRNNADHVTAGSEVSV